MTDKVIFHVDMDAFYAAVEQRDNPGLKGNPVIIGARPGTRGVVSACSYEARKFGVHSAMPISEAYRRCPDGIFLPVRMKRYQEVSGQIMKIFGTFTPAVRQISVDEAFLDMTGTKRLFGDPVEAAGKIKSAVYQCSDCTVSIGIGSNRFIAKLASEYDKPDGLWIVHSGEEESFLDKLRLKDLWGLGKKTLSRLEEMNITTVPKLRAFSEGVLQTMFGKAAGTYLYHASRGNCPDIFAEEPKSRSVSNEITFTEDLRDRDAILRGFLELSHQVMFRMMQSGYLSSTVVVKVRFEDFTTTTVQKTVRHPVRSAEELYATAKDLLRQRWNGSTPVRLIGVGFANVEEEHKERQGELFEEREDKFSKVEKTILELKKKHPKDAPVKANLLKPYRNR